MGGRADGEPSWSDIEEGALFSPVLQRAVHMVMRGGQTREQALLSAVLTLQRQVDTISQALLDKLQRQA